MPVEDLAWAQLSDLRRNNPEFDSRLRQRLDEEEKVIEYAKQLLEDYGKDVHESSSRIYFWRSLTACRLTQSPTVCCSY